MITPRPHTNWHYKRLIKNTKQISFLCCFHAYLRCNKFFKNAHQISKEIYINKMGKHREASKDWSEQGRDIRYFQHSEIDREHQFDDFCLLENEERYPWCSEIAWWSVYWLWWYSMVCSWYGMVWCGKVRYML